MKYRRHVLLLIFGLTLTAGCNGRERTRPGNPRSGDSALPMSDGGMVEDAAFDASSEDGAMVVEDAGVPDDARVTDSGPPVDSGTRDTGTRDTGTRDTGTRDTGPPTCAPGPGALAIVEVMVASQGGSDPGEWFEVVNTGSCAVDLSGLELGSPTTDGAPVTHTVTMGLLSPGDHHVFALSGDPAENHDLPWDYVYGTGTRSDVFLGNSGDVLTIAYAGVELDRVEWSSGDYSQGAALQYPRGASYSANGDIGRWCNATRLYSRTGGTYFGTPGAPNDTCP
ncbi:MAG: lamin tail domain-containing protein [Deltaproteobacteria bacterium]|nr:lamin tail domain-containing protein [Deltaproteobacteria bacterium]